MLDIPRRPSRRRSKWRGVVLALPGLIALGCVLDDDDLCGPNQVIWGDDQRCVCAEGTMYTADGCVPCGANETSSPAGCTCDAGYARSGPGQPCLEIPAGIGDACASSAECTNPDYPHCELTGAGGYCTKQNCATPADCSGGFACNLNATPSYCQRPPVGAGQACAVPEDCAGTEAIFCDTIVSGTCLVQDCSLAPDDCFTGMECCDMSAFALPNLCIPEGQCLQ